MVRPCDRAAPYAQHDFPDFAQEFLRRNSAYRAHHAAASRGTDTEKLARTWGLHFPVRSCCRPEARACVLARRRLPLRTADRRAVRKRVAPSRIMALSPGR